MKMIVERLGQQGDGVAGALHIAKVLPGEEIKVVDGRLQSVVRPSPERVVPFCIYFDRCGGCKFQHWAHEPYAKWKRQIVVDALQRVGIDHAVGELIDAHGLGRRRVVLHVRERDGAWHAGFMETKSHTLTEIDLCAVLEPALRDAPLIAAAFGPSLGPCDVAITAADNGLDVAVKAERSAVQRRLLALQDVFQSHKLCRLSVNGETLFSVEPPSVKIGQAQVVLPLNSFLQATRNGEETLALFVVGALKKAKRVADLFCGIGPFTFRLAEMAQIQAIDIDRASVGSLQHAVRHAKGLKPITSEVRDLFRNPLVTQELNEFDAVVIDPPRAGAETQVRNLAKSKVKQVISVSCDAQTFARDARILIDGGYKLTSVTPVDQFKWTAHVEIVGVFNR